MELSYFERCKKRINDELKFFSPSEKGIKITSSENMSESLRIPMLPSEPVILEVGRYQCELLTLTREEKLELWSLAIEKLDNLNISRKAQEEAERIERLLKEESIKKQVIESL